MRRLGIIAGLVLAVLLGGSGTAVAHNTLINSDPPEDARVSTGPKQVRLVFDQPVREGYNTITVVGPEGDYWTDGEVSVQGDTVTAPVRELGPPGTYTIGYRVLSNDGHSVTGKTTFTLTEAGGGTPAEPPENSGDQAPDQESSGMPIWPWIAGAAVLVVLGAVLAARLGKSGGE